MYSNLNYFTTKLLVSEHEHKVSDQVTVNYIESCAAGDQHGVSSDSWGTGYEIVLQPQNPSFSPRLTSSFRSWARKKLPTHASMSHWLELTGMHSVWFPYYNFNEPSFYTWLSTWTESVTLTLAKTEGDLTALRRKDLFECEADGKANLGLISSLRDSAAVCNYCVLTWMELYQLTLSEDLAHCPHLFLQ